MSNVLDTDVLVIGGGPAGLHAAREARMSGRVVTIVDEYGRLGGQYYRRPVVESVSKPAHIERRGSLLADELVDIGVRVLTDTLVYDAAIGEDRRLIVSTLRAGEARFISATAVVIASGGYDRVVPFPGWTLPGVLTAGGLQTVTKVLGVTPRRRVVIAGSGPFLLPVTKTVLKAGGTVAAVLEATTPRHWMPRVILPALLHVNRSAEAVRYQYVLARHGVRIQFGRRVVEVRGDGRAEEVVIAAVDREWQPVPGSESVIAADVVCAGYGFQSATQLPRLLGCAEVHRPAGGGWCPQVDAAQMTSVPGIFVAGEVAGIGGAHLAMVTGKVAGRSAAAFAGAPHSRRTLAPRTLRARGQWHRHFANAMNDIFDVPPGVYATVPDTTVVCRCEDVLARAVRAAAATQADVNFVKGVTRAGMGPCQGRICAHSISGIVTNGGRGTGDVRADQFTARAPIKPVPLAVLAERPDHDGRSQE